MKLGLRLSALFAAALLITACQTQPFFPTLFTKMSDGQIIKDIMVADDGEMATARLAKKKAKCPKVKRLADYLYKQHTECKHRIAHLSKRTGIKPEDSFYASQVESYYASELKSLEAASREDFDKAYIDYVIRDHQHALEFLDRAIKDASNVTLKADLKKARRHIEMHLRKAERIKARMSR